MCDIIALAFQTDKTRVASLLLARDLSSLYYPFLEVREGHHGASHDDLSDGYERISRFHLSQLAYLAQKLDAMPEGEGTVLDNCCLLWLSNMWAGWKHDNMKVPVVTVGRPWRHAEDRPLARLPVRGRREPQALQPVPAHHGSHGRQARRLRRRDDAAAGPVGPSRPFRFRIGWMDSFGYDEVLLRLAAAVLAGALIGFDREVRNKPAGLRTMALVALGSAVFVMTTVGAASADATSRAIQGIVTGVGFLGAGTIIRGRTEESVRGLTTAASTWLAAAVGIASGLALWPLVVVASGLGVLVLVLGPVDRWLKSRLS